MGKVFEGIDDHLRDWISRQTLFFVATAPLAGDGHVNASPKGPIGTLRVLDAHTIAYLDYIGSGAETIAHLRENGRIVVMLCAFDGPPRIVRLHGTGEVLTPDDARFNAVFATAGFEQPAAADARRAIVLVELNRIADSCGYGVPLLSFEGTRPHMEAWAAKKLRSGGADALVEYQRQNNSDSIDGLPALELRVDA